MSVHSMIMLIRKVWIPDEGTERVVPDVKPFLKSHCGCTLNFSISMGIMWLWITYRVVKGPKVRYWYIWILWTRLSACRWCIYIYTRETTMQEPRPMPWLALRFTWKSKWSIQLPLNTGWYESKSFPLCWKSMNCPMNDVWLFPSTRRINTWINTSTLCQNRSPFCLALPHRNMTPISSQCQEWLSFAVPWTAICPKVLQSRTTWDPEGCVEESRGIPGIFPGDFWGWYYEYIFFHFWWPN